MVTGDGVGGTTVTDTGDSITYTVHHDTFTNFESFHGSEYNDSFRGSDMWRIEEWFDSDRGSDVFFASKGDGHYDGGTRIFYSDDRPVGEFPEYGEVDYANLNGKVTVNLASREGQIRDKGNGLTYEHTYFGIESVVGSKYSDTLIGGRRSEKFEGGRGLDQLTGGDGADTFVFDGSVHGTDSDMIMDFDDDMDLIELIDMRREDGAAIERFGDLDTDGDGRLTGADTTAFTNGYDLLLRFDGGEVEIFNVTELTAEHFLFA